MTPIGTDGLLKTGHVLKKLQISRTTLYSLIRNAEFPARITLYGKVGGWLEKEIDEWLANRVSASRRGAKQKANSETETG